MKKCPKCTSENPDDSDICLSCGASLTGVSANLKDFSAISGSFLNKAKEIASSGAKKAQQVAADSAAKAKEHRQTVATQRAENISQSAKFLTPDESFKAVIGSNYLQNILGGGQLTKSAAILTEKRVYYYGKSFSGIGKNTKSSTEEAIIPAEDITLTRFVHGRDTGLLITAIPLLVVGIATIIAIIGIPLIIAGCYFLFRYFTGRTTMFEIAFPGGKYYFDVKWYPISDMQNFQRQLHLVRDRLKNK